MHDPRIAAGTGFPHRKFLDARGNQLRFNYHRIAHSGEYLPTVSQSIPAVWKDCEADVTTYLALRNWIVCRSRDAFKVVLLAAIRCVSAAAHSQRHGGDPNGDYMGAAIEATVDEVARWPDHDPGYTDGFDFIEERTFSEPKRPLNYNGWLTFYYMRWIKRAARRAIRWEIAERRRFVQLPEDVEELIPLGPSQEIRGKWYVSVKAESREPSDIIFDREFNTEFDWILDEQCGLAKWLKSNVSSPVELEIIKTRVAEPWRTHSQIIEVVNAALGTKHSHDKVSKTLEIVESKMLEWMEDEFEYYGKADVSPVRATGLAPDTLVSDGDYREPPIGASEAAAQFELDEDGYKIGPKVRRRPKQRPPSSWPPNPAMSA